MWLLRLRFRRQENIGGICLNKFAVALQKMTGFNRICPEVLFDYSFDEKLPTLHFANQRVKNKAACPWVFKCLSSIPEPVNRLLS